ncbi:MAG: hypothetical protein ACPGYT_15120 [Nitrospirales bacterium]
MSQQPKYEPPAKTAIDDAEQVAQAVASLVPMGNELLNKVWMPPIERYGSAANQFLKFSITI